VNISAWQARSASGIDVGIRADWNIGGGRVATKGIARVEVTIHGGTITVPGRISIDREPGTRRIRNAIVVTVPGAAQHGDSATVRGAVEQWASRVAQAVVAQHESAERFAQGQADEASIGDDTSL
jgi:hypothetical protein